VSSPYRKSAGCTIATSASRPDRTQPLLAIACAAAGTAKAAGFPGKLMHDFRRTAATRLDSTPGISRSVAMTLLGHKTDIMFRRYIQTHDERLVEAANALAKHRASEMANGFRRENGTKSV
jgi:integrase